MRSGHTSLTSGLPSDKEMYVYSRKSTARLYMFIAIIFVLKIPPRVEPLSFRAVVGFTDWWSLATCDRIANAIELHYHVEVICFQPQEIERSCL